MNFKALKENAKNQLKLNSHIARQAALVKFLVSIALLIPYMLCIYPISANNQDSSSTPFLFFICLIMIIVLPIFDLAVKALIAQIAKAHKSDPDKRFTLKDYFANFNLFGKSILNMLWTELWIFLWELVVLVPLCIIAAIITYFVLTNTDNTQLISSILPFIMVIALLPLVIYKAISYSLNIYAIADDTETGVIEAMNISKAVTKGHRGELLGFYLSFTGWYILGIITFGISDIWIEPYMTMSIYNAYKELESTSDSVLVQPKITSSDNSNA